MNEQKTKEMELYFEKLRFNVLALFEIAEESNNLILDFVNGDSIDSNVLLKEKSYDNIIIWGYVRDKIDIQDLLAALKDDGSILIFTDNRMAFKTLTGFKRNNTKELFEDLYNDNKELYSYREWIEVLDFYSDIGYDMYYLYPNWRYPVYVFSDEKLPQPGELNLNGFNPLEPRVCIFDDDKLLDSINREGLFPQFSNSFLIRIYKKK